MEVLVMSRAFVSEDQDGPSPRLRYPLPPPDDPGFQEAAARALLDGANIGDSIGAEEATGFPFGDQRLVPQIRLLLEQAREEQNDRYEQLAERFLRKAGDLDD
jgi:hypothetical protein